ncbi:ChrR family anti-sigma-E factor [Rhodobacteraceae bacterium KMM 6894]|nr:ChrR family anti-sigma-E factor [Rhodobacteraceae bacterium KMM 6894]
MTQPIQHHLTDALLMAYSAGALPEAFNLTVATHIAMCDECRARLGAFDSVGGALIESGASHAMAPDSMAAALAKAKSAPRARQPTRNRSNVPVPLQDYIGTDLTAVHWRPVGMGVKQAILPTDKGATARLIYIPAGIAVPDHGHRGTELTLVLQGAFFDQTDRFAAGDIEVAGEELDHTPTAEMGADCICLAATDAPLRFRSLIPRLAQPFLRI